MSDEKDTLDRAWNFLSDLGPLLNLFGEGVTTQFLRGSLFLEDHILLATLPIGIVTIIVSAIRVAGPMWLKAIIGRAGESRGTVELQLMSSTSQFVSELWDGMTMVRVLAKAPIYEILYLDANPDADPDADKPADKLADNPVDKRNFYRLREAENDSIMLRKLAPRSLLWHWIRSTLLGRRKEYIKVPPKAASGLDPYQSSTPGENCSPTVILNIGNAAGGNGLLIAVGLGLLFQIGVLIIIGFSSYNSRTAQLFNIHDTPPRYVTIAAIVGTVTVSAGVLICSIVIDSRTQEFVHRLNPDTHAKHIFQLFWLQKGGAVNDQEFGSYAIFPRYQLDRIISSGPLDHNVKKGNSVINDHEMMNPLGEEQASTIARFSATVGSFLTLSGFILQVLGLRGMPLAAPLSIQCGTLLLLGLRATVRRRRTTRPYIVVLPVNFELEKLALDFTRAGGPISLWLEMKERSTSRLWNLKERLKQRDEEDQQQAHSHRKLQSIFIAAAQLKHQNPMDWKPDGTIMERNPNGLFKIRGSDGKSSLWVVNDIRCPQKWDVDQTITRAVDMRMELGRVTRLSSAARSAVISLINAMEGVLDNLFPPNDKAKRHYTNPLGNYKRKVNKAIHDRSASPFQKVAGIGLFESPAVFPIQITFSLTEPSLARTVEYGLRIEYHEGYGWFVTPEEVEAILSMSCYSLHRIHNSPTLFHLQSATSNQPIQDNIVLDLLGSPKSNNTLFRWWAKGATDSLLQVRTEMVFREKSSYPLCPKSSHSQNMFSLHSANVIGVLEDNKNGPSERSKDNRHIGWHSFEFRKNPPEGRDMLTLQGFVIDSQKVFVPVCQDQKIEEQNSEVEDRDNWTLATVSATTIELACAKKIFSAFLDSLFVSSKADDIRARFAGSSTIVNTTETNSGDICELVERSCHLQNEGIERLLCVVRDSGLYESGYCADLRVISSLAEADLLPTATDPILRWIKGFEQVESVKPIATKAYNQIRVVCFWLLDRLAPCGSRGKNPHLTSAVLHTLELLVILYRHRCVEETQGQPMVGGPWVFNPLMSSRMLHRKLLEEESQISHKLGLNYPAVQDWIKSYPSSNSASANNKTDESGQDSVPYLTKELMKAYLLKYKSLSEAHSVGWKVLCGSSVSSSKETDYTNPKTSPIPSPLQAPLQGTAAERAMELFHFVYESSGQHDDAQERNVDIRCLSPFTWENEDIRSWVPFHYFFDQESSRMIARHHSIGEFHCAAAVGEEEIFLNLTSRGDLATGDEFGRTPLHLAVCGGHKKIVEILVNEAVDVYAADQWGRSPVQLAVATGRKDILRLLLYPNDQRSNGKINAVDKWGYATIHYAVVSGDLEIVKMVCEQPGFQLRKLKPKGGLTRMELDGERRKHLNHTGRVKVPVLHLAHSVAIVEFLVETTEANILERDDSKRTLLHAATELPALEVVDLLLSKSNPDYNQVVADSSNGDEDAKTPLHLVSDTMVLQRLLQDHRLRSLINKRDVWDCTPLHYAVLRNKVNIAEILIKEGADTTFTDSMGRTPSDYISFIEEKPDPKLRDILETP